MSSVSPGGADLVPTTPDWPAWVGFMVTTHFDLVSGPFHSPNFIGLHSVSTSANMYHLHTCAGELPRSASCHFCRCYCGAFPVAFRLIKYVDIWWVGVKIYPMYTSDIDMCTSDIACIHVTNSENIQKKSRS